jgi:hypothetical protein
MAQRADRVCDQAIARGVQTKNQDADRAADRVRVVGGQTGINALSGTIYPTYMRSTGSGWALGMGRIGRSSTIPVFSAIPPFPDPTASKNHGMAPGTCNPIGTGEPGNQSILRPKGGALGPGRRPSGASSRQSTGCRSRELAGIVSGAAARQRRYLT